MKCSLRSLFSSSQFIEALNRFQKLVKEGLFNFSLSGVNLEDWKSLRRLLLNNSVKSEWAHSYEQIKVLNILFFLLIRLTNLVIHYLFPFFLLGKGAKEWKKFRKNAGKWVWFKHGIPQEAT